MSAEGGLTYWLKKQLSAFEEKFDVADVNKNGSLSYDEVCNVLRSAGFKGSDDEMKSIFKFADVNKDSKISRSEYKNAVMKAPKVPLKEILLRRAFKKYDQDGSGFLTREEIMKAVESEEAGVNLPAEKAAEMLLHLVKDADKKISYEEFLTLFHYNQTATLLQELFNRIDTDKSGVLTKAEILAAIKSDDELSFNAANLSQLLLTFSKNKTDQIKYEEFARVVATQAKK